MKKRGFTLIEMLIVIVIIGILAGALIPRIGSARDKANDTAVEANVRSLSTAMVSYGLDNGPYPADSDFTGNTLSKYSIPNGNFDGQPVGTTYHYKQLDSGKHFLFWATLSAGSGENGGGNCNAATASTTTSYADASAWSISNGDSFCYFQ